MKKPTITAIFAMMIFAPLAHGKGKPAKAPQEPRYWYVMKAEGKTVGYYSEVFYQEKKKSFITLQEWRSPGNSKEFSRIETLTTDDSRLSPISFDLHHIGESSELKISALIKKKKNTDLNVKMIRIKPTSERLENEIPLPRETIFYSSLPRFLARHESGMYAVKAIMEDARDVKLQIKQLNIHRTGEAKKFGGDECVRSYVELQGPTAEIWVTKAGKLCEMSIAEANSSITLATEAEITALKPKK